MPRTGRPRKADAIKIASGTYREDRDGDLGQKVDPAGDIVRPKFALPEARAFWDRVVTELIELKVVKSTDVSKAAAMCECWALMRRALKVANNDPIDKDARIAYLGYVKQWGDFAAMFGLDPSSRSRLLVDKDKKPAIQGRQRGG